MRCRIHRGCHEIGGNCVEFESQGKRIVLDIGLPLNPDASVELPDIDGLHSFDESLLGMFISHPHPDHYGLLEQIKESVPIYMGESARKIIEVSSFFTPLPSLGNLAPQSMKDGEPITKSPFTITPISIDHSAHDSYCLLVEAEGKRVLYSGDLRAHGRKSHLFQRIVTNSPADVDVVICEGTQIGRTPEHSYQDENVVASRMAELFKGTKGVCLVWCSSQNTDRVASVFQAAKEAGRGLIIDLYTAEIMRAASDISLPRPGSDGVKVYLPLSQKQLIKREQAYQISNRYYPHRIYPEKLAVAAPKSVMIFRPKMLRELKKQNCLKDGLLITSLWSGTVKKEIDCIQEVKSLGLTYDHVHTSGHATVEELQQFVNAFPNSRIVPIHLEDREGFGRMTSSVEFRNDREWWEV